MDTGLIGKEQVARRLIHGAIRSIMAKEDPVPVHVMTMAGFDVLRYYAQVKRIATVDLRSMMAKPERFKAVIDQVNAGYNFCKHARNDVDDTFDVSQFNEANSAVTLLNSITFHNVFGYTTAHMGLFKVYQMMEYPQLIAEEFRDVLVPTFGPPAERYPIFKEAFEEIPEVKKEREEDTGSAWA